MEIIHAKVVEENNTLEFEEIEIIKSFMKAEFVISLELDSSKNDFELQFNENAWLASPIQRGEWIYIPNTEWGGRVEKIEHVENIIKVSGVNYRYLLHRDILLPRYNPITKKREKTLLLDGDMNAILHQLKDYVLATNTVDLYDIETKNQNVYKRLDVSYLSIMEAIEKIVENENLYVSIKQQYNTNKLLIELKTLGYFEETVDHNLNITIDSSVNEMNEYNFVVGIGVNGTEEYVVFFARDDQYNIKEVDIQTSNIESKTLVKQCVLTVDNVKSKEELKEKVVKQLTETGVKETIELYLKEETVDFNVGDIISGKDTITDLTIQTKVIEKKLQINDKGHNIEYKVGD